MVAAPTWIQLIDYLFLISNIKCCRDCRSPLPEEEVEIDDDEWDEGDEVMENPAHLIQEDNVAHI